VRNGSILTQICGGVTLIAILLAAWFKTSRTLNPTAVTAAAFFVAAAFFRARTLKGRLGLVHIRVRTTHPARRLGE
jgi:hypothetical protein